MPAVTSLLLGAALVFTTQICDVFDFAFSIRGPPAKELVRHTTLNLRIGSTVIIDNSHLLTIYQPNNTAAADLLGHEFTIATASFYFFYEVEYRVLISSTFPLYPSTSSFTWCTSLRKRKLFKPSDLTTRRHDPV